MLTKEELKEFSTSVEILREECNKYPGCSGCVLVEFCVCTPPSEWEIPKEDNKVLQALSVVKAMCSKFPVEDYCSKCPLCKTCMSDISEWKVSFSD